MMSVLQCPNCQKTVEWTMAFPFRPFCSERCRTIDLGAWADDRYRVPMPTAMNADTQIDLEDLRSSQNED